MSDWMDGPEDKQVLGERCLLMGVLEQLVLAVSIIVLKWRNNWSLGNKQ